MSSQVATIDGRADAPPPPLSNRASVGGLVLASAALSSVSRFAVISSLSGCLFLFLHPPRLLPPLDLFFIESRPLFRIFSV